MDSLSLHQGIFLTQEPNQGLPHCRWILHQLSYEGSPIYCIKKSIYLLQWRGVVVLQLCPTLCNPMDWSPPDSSIHGILQARILE